MSLPRFTFTTRATPFVEIGVGDSRTDIGVGRWDQSHWDNAADATWSGVEPLWLDMTCESFGIDTNVGRQRVTDAFAPGTASLTVTNFTGWADPKPPGDDQALLKLRAGRAVRVGVDHTTLGRLVLFRGFVDRTEPRYDPAGRDVVDLSCIDALGEVGRGSLAELAAPVGDNELAGSRISRILTAAKWPATKRSLDQTGVAMLATTFGQQVADELTQTAESAGGACFGDEQGRVCFRGRDWQTYDPTDPVDGIIGNGARHLVTLAEDPAGSDLYDPDGYTFSEDPAGSDLYESVDLYLVADPISGLYALSDEPADACPTGWILSSDRSDIVTQVVLGRTVDEVPQEWNDPKGQSLYGIETYERTDLICSSTSQLTTLKSRIFRTRGYTVTPRVERVDLDAATSLEALDLMAIATPYEPSRIRCRLQLARGLVFDTEMFVTGVRHTITPDAWLCALDLDWAKPFATVAGRWDEDDWDQALWSAPTTLADALESLRVLEVAS